eukprot:323260-Amphidinium_carterae.1
MSETVQVSMPIRHVAKMLKATTEAHLTGGYCVTLLEAESHKCLVPQKDTDLHFTQTDSHKRTNQSKQISLEWCIAIQFFRSFLPSLIITLLILWTSSRVLTSNSSAIQLE